MTHLAVQRVQRRRGMPVTAYFLLGTAWVAYRPVSGQSGGTRMLDGITGVKTAELRAIVREIDEILRDRLKAADIQIEHALVAMNPDGSGFVRSNVQIAELGDMAIMLAALVTKATIEEQETTPVH